MELIRARIGHWYVAAVSVAGAAVLSYLAATGSAALVADADLGYWVFGLLVLLGELWPIKVRRGDEGGEVTTSPTFALALLLSYGMSAAILPLAVASLVADTVARKPPFRALFNMAQYTLALLLGGVVLQLFPAGATAVLAGDYINVGHLLPMLAAGAAFFLSNNVLTGTAIALDQGVSVRAFLRRDFAFHVSTTGVLLALSPVLVVVAERSLPLIALLLVAVAGLYRSARNSREKEHEALHDLLTDLPNRRLFQERISESLYEAKRCGHHAAVMLIDLDKFKEINDSLGHHIGDAVLQAVGPRLRHSLREVDVIARLGGDEFAVLMPDVESAETAMAVARRLIAALERPIVVDGFPLDISASIGVALYPEHGENVQALMQRADVAMYRAKTAQTGAELYDHAVDANSHGRMSLLTDLREAIDGGHIGLHYQPIADMRTGRVRTIEALARWHHPVHGPIPPEEFVPMAEQTEMIAPLTRLVLDRALEQIRNLHQQGFMVSVSVNLSVHNLYERQFPREVDRLLSKWRIAPSWLELEVTETTVMADPTRAMDVLEELSDMGVRLAIDDFGTGYSSLMHLKQLPVNQIKIDRTFISNMTASGDESVIVRSIIELARSLGLRVVAEGVEDEDVCDWLSSAGCDLAQGFYLSRPMPGGEVMAWLEGFIDRPHVLPGGRSRPVLPGREPRLEPRLEIVRDTHAGGETREVS